MRSRTPSRSWPTRIQNTRQGRLNSSNPLPANLAPEVGLPAHLPRQQLERLRANLEADSRRLAHVTTELRDDVRLTRMLPVSNVFNSLPRVVRDLATQLGKDVHLSIQGAETEVDRSVLEHLRAPLT